MSYFLPSPTFLGSTTSQWYLKEFENSFQIFKGSVPSQTHLEVYLTNLLGTSQSKLTVKINSSLRSTVRQGGTEKLFCGHLLQRKSDIRVLLQVYTFMVGFEGRGVCLLWSTLEQRNSKFHGLPPGRD